MAFLVVGVVAFFVSGLTLFAGFGLGTLLLPVFALFFPVEVAVAATAVVHGLNGLFKVALLGRHAVRRIVVAFGIPAVGAAFVGAAGLTVLSSGAHVLLHWEILGREAVVTPVKAVMGSLILVFALFELHPRLRMLSVPAAWLPAGGILAGFFGGLSGHQGALRAAFLTPLGLGPAAYAGTQAVLAVMVDASRILVYGIGYRFGALGSGSEAGQWPLVGVATLCAFGGALAAKRFLPSVTIRSVRTIAGVLLLVVGVGLTTGLLG